MGTEGGMTSDTSRERVVDAGAISATADAVRMGPLLLGRSAGDVWYSAVMR